MYSNFKVKIFVDVFLMRLNLYFDELVKCNNIKFFMYNAQHFYFDGPGGST